MHPEPQPVPPSPAPAATGVRLDWGAVPAGVRTCAEERWGGAVVAAVSQAGGFSPGVAARVRLADGRRLFVKAVGPEPNPGSPGFHRREAGIAAALPVSVPVPRLLDHLETEGWVVLAYEEIAGRQPREPWSARDLARVLHAAGELAVRLTPAPPLGVPSLADDDGFRHWRLLLHAYEAGEAEAAETVAGLPAWARARLPALAEREAGWPDAVAGTTLLHCDLRADNLLLTEDPDRPVVFVDWPHAATGAAWFDVVGMGPSVLMGAPGLRPLLDAHLSARGADPAAVATALVGVAGLFLTSAARPAPPGLPTLRPFQRAQGEAALTWLRASWGGV
ncbi:aminoglycoside phosphotransferase family protein [Streptomyces sp. SID11385]|uniref:phosphotransferase family protein n=1 Tax=Streptomyces sp. SID11385 TaxID=2706031 RepID=UPI0013CB998E|nr:aminoglycoside phosphotransferase family protein [Streptomyces sp. SID11385]NEA43131.1 aminoglycoside phosphotransferase family protein [Streptomyces sp. SID11385]